MNNRNIDCWNWVGNNNSVFVIRYKSTIRCIHSVHNDAARFVDLEKFMEGVVTLS
jgi:hypothetical protein